VCTVSATKTEIIKTLFHSKMDLCYLQCHALAAMFIGGGFEINPS